MKEFEENCKEVFEKYLTKFKAEMRPSKTAKDKAFNEILSNSVSDLLLKEILQLGTEAIEIKNLPKSQVFQIAKMCSREFREVISEF